MVVLYTGRGSRWTRPAGRSGALRRWAIALALAVVGVTLATTPAAPQAGFVFTTFDGLPDSGPASGIWPAGITGSGLVVGFYQAAGMHGFVRDRQGAVSRLDPAGAAVTRLSGANERGQIAGFSAILDPATSRYTYESFVYTDGVFAPVAVPGARLTDALAINGRGDVAGIYEDGRGTHGFVRTAGGELATVDPPGAAYAYAVAINDAGQVAGYYDEAGTPGTHGFVRDPGRGIATFDYPGARYTLVAAINGRGQVAGTAWGTVRHAFVYERGALATVDLPGAVARWTVVSGINDAGQIVGRYGDAAGRTHGFVRDPDGRVATVDVPASLSPAGVIETVVTAVNAAGQVAGWYVDGAFRVHGFTASPAHNVRRGPAPSPRRARVPLHALAAEGRPGA